MPGVRRAVVVLALAGLAMGLAACSKPFDYDTASEAERAEFFELASQGLYDGLEQSIPHGKNGIYMRMNSRKVDVARRRIEILVDVQNDEDEEPNFSGLTQSRLLGTVCPAYLDGDLNRNAVTVYVRFAMPHGGTAAAVSATPASCARFAGQG